MDAIKIRGLEVKACHGVYGFEKENAQKFVFDAEIVVDFADAERSDSVDDTVSYADVCSLIVNCATENKFNLLEKLAGECANRIFEKFERVKKVSLSCYKPDAPMDFKFKTVGVRTEKERVRAYLSLGSSEGNRQENLKTAIALLNGVRGVRVEKVSSVIETLPYGGAAKNKFLNCAVCVSTFISPHTLLNEIHKIEASLGRVRTVRWGDRTTDIDIIFYGSQKICDDRLIIPHPDYKNRDFVLIPLKEICQNIPDIS